MCWFLKLKYLKEENNLKLENVPTSQNTADNSQNLKGSKSKKENIGE